MSAMSTSRARKTDPMAKKIPENPKYKHVRATVDTGASLTKYMAKIDDIKQNYKYRKDEIFKRMKVTTFVQLVIQVYHISEDDFQLGDVPSTPMSERPDTADAEILKINSGGSPAPSLALTDGDFGHDGDTSRSTLLSVAQGVGEMDLNEPPQSVPATPASSYSRGDLMDATCPYLLLDVRDHDSFSECHIITARSYPKSELSKACNYETKDMLQYKNVAGRVIVLYDEDERMAPAAATTLVQRGYDNLFMLSGGLKVAHKVVPEGLLTGTPPLTVSGVKAKSIVPAAQKHFTFEDINKIEIYLDNALQDNSIGKFVKMMPAGDGASGSFMGAKCSLAYMNQTKPISQKMGFPLRGRLSKASTASSRVSTSRSSVATTRSATSVREDRPPFR